MAKTNSMQHGLSYHPLYHLHKTMIARCHHPSSYDYYLYGARGIRVCAWWHDVAVFIHDIEQEIGPRPEGLTLDRIDNEGNYEPGNVKWSTAKEQANNRRTRNSRVLNDNLILRRRRLEWQHQY